MSQNHNKGRRAEALACGFLKGRGFSILHRNYRVPGGEIDIIAQSPEGEIVFVEVKASFTGKAGSPESRVHGKKIFRIFWAAQCWIQAHCMENQTCRFDVLTLKSRPGQALTWHHYAHAYMPEIRPENSVYRAEPKLRHPLG